MRAYGENRRAAIEGVIDADPVAGLVRTMMTKLSIWSGNASELLRIGADSSRHGHLAGNSAWPRSPGALAGRLRRAQTSPRSLGIEIAFSREGKGGTRVIRISSSPAQRKGKTVSSVSTVSDDDPSNLDDPTTDVGHIHCVGE